MSRKSMILLATALATGSVGLSTPAYAGTEDYIGEVTMGGYNFCPRGTAIAQGQLLSIAQNTALFSLLGTQYGGNGQTTFALPNLAGRSPMNQGNGPGLTPRVIGEEGGAETQTLTINTMPAHTHTGLVRAENTVLADTGNPQGNVIARAGINIYSNNSPPSPTAALHPGTLDIGINGGGQPMTQMQPYLVLTYCIAIQGIFPSRN